MRSSRHAGTARALRRRRSRACSPRVAAPLAEHRDRLHLRRLRPRAGAGRRARSVDVPPEDNSAMDGYAVRSADVAGGAGTLLPVSQRIAAGRVGAAACAPAPRRASSPARRCRAGADAVVMQEDCEAVAADGRGRPFGACASTSCRRPAWIRRHGEDVREGRRRAARRPPPDAAGHRPGGHGGHGAAARSRARPRVALFSTGDELVMPGEPLTPGRDLQLQPLHAARAAARPGLRRHRPRHRARPPRRHARDAARAPRPTTT